MNLVLTLDVVPDGKGSDWMKRKSVSTRATQTEWQFFVIPAGIRI